MALSSRLRTTRLSSGGEPGHAGGRRRQPPRARRAARPWPGRPPWPSDGVGHQLAQWHPLEGELQRVGLDAGQLEQVVDQAGQPVGLADELAVVARDLAGSYDHPVVERLDHGPDARDRRAQVVAHPGHQLAAAALERPLPLGHGRRPGRRARSSSAGRGPAPPSTPAVPAPAMTTTSAARSWRRHEHGLGRGRAPSATATTGMSATTTGLRDRRSAARPAP